MAHLYISYDERVFDLLGEDVDTQIVTSTWTDWGNEIDNRNYNRLSLYLTAVMNASTNVQLRVLAKHDAAHADEFDLPIRSVQEGKVTLKPVIYELSNDSDQKIQIDMSTPPGSYIQLQIKDDASGSGELSAMYMLSYQ